VKPFRERNPVVVGFVGIAVIALLLLSAFRADKLPLIGGGDTYYAEFGEVGGLGVGDEVRVAGVRVGEVEELTLEGDTVRVRMLLDKGVELGSSTRADIRVKTLLGDMYLALDPAGGAELEAGGTIGKELTTSPYDVVDAFEGFAETTNAIDTDQLSEALDSLSQVMEQTPEEVRGTLDGLSRLSRNVAARDEQINSLLVNLRDVSGVLADRNESLVTLFEDGTTLFRAVSARREAIHDLLVSTRELSGQLSGLVRDTRADLRPALDNLQNVLDVLNKNQENLDESLRLMAPFYRVFANVLSTGPWFDTYIQNLPPLPAVS
jgi:phospholipid/cholesterol/gamma-HCH transport system substrate-binding protein